LWLSLGTSFLAFIAGFQTQDRSLFEAGAIDGIRNRFQELFYITVPSMKPQLMFGAVIQIAGAFGVGAVPRALGGFPSTNYSLQTIETHIFDYGSIRYEMGYASAIAFLLAVVMILTRNLIAKLLQDKD
jgi:multiple sugar transport system permease protein